MVAVVAQPDAVDVLDVLDVGHGGEGDVDDAVEVVVALLHLGLEDADDLEADAVDADGLAEREDAGEELGLGFGADDGDVGARLDVRGRDDAALGDVHVLNRLELGLDAVDLPGVGVEFVLDGDVLPDDGGDVDDAGDGLLDVFDVVAVCRRTLTPALAPPACSLVVPGKTPIMLVPNCAKMVSNGAAEAGAVGEQKDDGGDAPGHADDGDGVRRPLWRMASTAWPKMSLSMG